MTKRTFTVLVWDIRMLNYILTANNDKSCGSSVAISHDINYVGKLQLEYGTFSV